MHVIGTAGHVDHGKSTLVEALTGIDPDRLREEKERQMTIVLGFAWLTMPDGESVGIIDVPGHQDFIRNMLSGVGGIDAALLVIAADEGVMPQTREHLAILDLLQVQGGVIALTKVDLVEDPEWIELVEADVAEQVEGTVLADAPMIAVSAYTGEGLDELVAALAACLRKIPPRSNMGRPRLSVDRVFTIAGFGTVVTGTLIGGSLQIGQEVEILPSARPARVRGLQTHGSKIEEATPGSRVAINLTGLSKDEVSTGDVVTVPGWLRPTMLIDAQLHYLADATRPLRHNTQVDFFCGAAEIPARVRLLGADALAPGETGWVQIRLSRPTAVVRGDRFIIRRLSPSATIGGGMVLDPAPRRRYRRFRPEVIERLETLAHGSPEEIVLQALARREPREVRALVSELSLSRQSTLDALQSMLDDQRVLIVDAAVGEETRLERPGMDARYVVSASGWQQIRGWMYEALVAYHSSYPLRRGMPREELRSRLQEHVQELGGRLFGQIVARAVAEGLVEEDEALVWTAEHEVRLTPDQQARVEALLEEFRKAPYTPPAVSECTERLGEQLFYTLLENGTLVRISPEIVYRAETLQEMRERVVDLIRAEGSATVAQVRDLFGASRKYIVALMEYLDQERVTRRVGDARVLRDH
jgi:selenocysteine-specific elongation factor